MTNRRGLLADFARDLLKTAPNELAIIIGLALAVFLSGSTVTIGKPGRFIAVLAVTYLAVRFVLGGVSRAACRAYPALRSDETLGASHG